MPIKVEAAIVTQKKPLAEYNTDSVNVNGKVMPREVIQNGYKGSGVLSGKVYFTLASSAVEGFADASVVAFNERAELFARARDPISVFSGFFEDCRGALFGMNRSEDELVSAGFYASGRRAVLAHNGDTKLYLHRLGIVTPVTADKVEDTTADFSAAVFGDVCEGDIFILLSPGAAQVLGDKEIEDILRISDGSVKRAINYMLKVALAGDGDKAVSAIVVKVLETGLDEDIIPEFIYDETDGNITSAAEDNDTAEAVPDAVEASGESGCDTDSDTLNEASDDAAAETTDEVTDEAAEEDIAEENIAEAAEDVVEIVEDENSEAVAEDEEATDAASDISEAFSKNALEMFEMPEIVENPDSETDSQAEDESSVIVFDESVFFEDAAEKTENTTEKESSISEKTKKGSKKLKTFLLFGLGMLIAFAAAAIVVFFIKPSSADSPEEITVEEITTAATIQETTDEEATDEEATDEEASGEAASEDVSEEEVFIVG